MVDYCEKSDFVGYGYRKKPIDPEEARLRREKRNAARTEDDWRTYAKDIVYRQLAVRDRCTNELLKALDKRDVPAPIADSVVNACVQSGLVNDAEFAMRFVRNRFREKTLARKRLVYELRQRGISQEISEQAVASISDDEENAAAEAFARRKLQLMRHLSVPVIRRRIYTALMRRGFSAYISRSAVQEALSEIDSGEENSAYGDIGYSDTA